MDKFMGYLCQNYPECFETPQVTYDIQEASNLILEIFGSDAAPKIALKIMLDLGRMKHAFPVSPIVLNSLTDLISSSFFFS